MDTNIIWFAGFIDGEGCFTSQIYKNTVSTRFIDIKPYFILNQTPKNGISFLERIKKIDKRYNLGFDYYVKKSKLSGNLFHSIQCRNIKNVKKLIRLILPYLSVKKDIATLILDNFPSGQRISHSGCNFDKKTGRFISGSKIPLKINWHKIYKAAKFIDKLRSYNNYRKNSIKWNGKALIDFYKNLETNQALDS